jgi:hypothetical protein
MNNEVERMWKEGVVDELEILTLHLPEDNHVPLSQESRYSGLDSSVDPL